MIVRTFSTEAVRAVLAKDDLVTECHGSKADLPNINLDLTKIKFILSFIGDEIAGFVAFHEIQNHTYMKHWGFYKEFRHDNIPITETLLAFAWLKQQDSKAVVLAMPPITNQASVKGNQKLGLSIIGQTHNTLEVDGHMVDQVILQKSL